MSGVTFKEFGGAAVQSKRWGLSAAFQISYDGQGMPELAVSGAGGDHDIGEHQDTTFTSLAADEFMVRNPGNTAWVNRDLANADIPATLTSKTLGSGCTWSGNAIPWTSVSKTGSTLASLETRLISSTTGTLTVGRGGTNSTGFTDEQLLYYDSGSASILSSGVARTQVARLDVTSGLQTFQTRIAITNTQVGTVALAVTGDPYLSTVTTIATFVGDTDGLRIQNVAAGDYRISNTSGVGGAITFYDGTSGLRLRYSSTDRLAVDSAGGVTIMSGGLRTTSHGEVITQAGGWTGDAIGGAYIGSHNHDAGEITTGILAVARGGTGQSAFTNGEVVYTVGGDLQSWKHIDYVAQLDKTSLQTFTGNLEVDKASPSFVLDRDATTEYAVLGFLNIGVTRWNFAMLNTAAADFRIHRHNDVGVYQDAPLILYRSTGNANIADLAISNGGTITSGTWNGTAIASGYIGSHSHDAGDIGSGILGVVRGGTGSGSVYTAGEIIYYQATGFQGWKDQSDIAVLDLSSEQTFSGDIGIDKASPILRIDRTATSQWALFRFQNAGVDRWALAMENTAGGDLYVRRYNDAGVFQDNPLIIDRTTGNVNLADLAVSNGGTITAGTWTGTAIASAYIGSHSHDAGDIGSGILGTVRGGTGSGSVYTAGDVVYYIATGFQGWKHIDNIAQLDNASLQVFTGDLEIDSSSPTLTLNRTGTGQYSWVEWQNVDVVRWRFGMVNDAGGDLGLWRYNDAGAYQDMPLRLYRSSGNALIADLAISNGGTITSGTWTGSVIGSAYIGSHNHDATDITSGKLAIARGGTNWDGGYSEGFVIRYFGGRMDDWIATSDVTLLSGVQTISGVKTFSTYWTSNVAVSGTIYAWGGTGYTACKRITTQGGFSLGCDSCMLLHAGDNTDNLVSELSITAGYTSENVFITADTHVYVITGRQAGVYPTYTKMFTFLNTGNFDMAGSIVNATWAGDVIGFAYGGRGGYSFGVAHDEELIKYDHGTLQFQPSGLDITYVAMTNQAEVWTENLRVSGAQALVNIDDDGTVSSSYYCDWGDSNVHKVQISNSVTIYVGSGSSCHPLPGGEYHLIVRAGGSYTLTINGVSTWFSATSSPFVMASGTVIHFFFTCVDDVGGIVLHGWASDAKTAGIT